MYRYLHVRSFPALLLGCPIHQCVTVTYSLDVGAGGPSSTPDTIQAAVGDASLEFLCPILTSWNLYSVLHRMRLYKLRETHPGNHFRFVDTTHNVVRAEYEIPCVPIEPAGEEQKPGFSSGYLSVTEGVVRQPMLLNSWCPS